jgi:hypothetical protein
MERFYGFRRKKYAISNQVTTLMLNHQNAFEQEYGIRIFYQDNFALPIDSA